ncbi:hypothetical protein DPX16_21949 [Anabarilius grahami]|uniref:Uncharacterized protein n=1 Tax=Anabarilius grahami TaxID=495550 RepID=A0A3N0XME5_ANAGA|nr:hypothetical protein DPX16_21949 [Anabarilius grahami]
MFVSCSVPISVFQNDDSESTESGRATATHKNDGFQTRCFIGQVCVHVGNDMLRNRARQRERRHGNRHRGCVGGSAFPKASSRKQNNWISLTSSTAPLTSPQLPPGGFLSQCLKQIVQTHPGKAKPSVGASRRIEG